MLEQILKQYNLSKPSIKVIPFGSGLINHTWLVKDDSNDYILQRINRNIFKIPGDIAYNINLLGKYLSVHHPGYLFVKPVAAIDGEDMAYIEAEGYFRLFPFVKESHTIDVVSNPSQAFEAAQQFGRFTKLLSGFDTAQLKVTLPDFHNLPLRYQQFENALVNGNKERIKESEESIKQLKKFNEIVTVSEAISRNPAFKKRVTHHDTKISNVLFNEADKGLCVIDLDTVMPGYFISDVGDMFRTYLSPVSEEEKDFTKIEIRDEYYHAIKEGYLGEMNKELSVPEKEHFIYAGKFMIYMQALRFLTDHLNNDVYYGAKYEGHNFMRANNQLTLLQRLLEKEKSLLAKPVI
ncbi:MAG: aminoglycoside phosphotransferase family protein [Sphingobacteriales bacterium]|nr:aminoglycoside phosphotransferase family protein [Sphingobacteriales bacterium]